MGLAIINIWVSDVADPCATWQGSGTMSILDCNGVLEWPCGRYLSSDGKWLSVPGGVYENLPFTCGHLEVEVPPGCYWVIAGSVSRPSPRIHLNYTTHVGIVQARCDERACVKLFNPSIRLCWDWFLVGMRVLAATGHARVDPQRIKEFEKHGEELLPDTSRLPIEEAVERIFDALVSSAKKEGKGGA